ncbi:hypothetical protein ZWY2020_034359 [Hordeum vulgare]|nr:hypothetical protein ZWY2020_034359 [Hordeum vulgare]
MGKLDAVRCMVEELGFDVNSGSQSGQTTLVAAASDERMHVMRYLLDKGAVPNKPVQNLIEAMEILVEGSNVKHVDAPVTEHPTDAELINSPLEYYNYMELCFANKHATGIYSMGMSMPLGTPIVVEDKDKPNVREGKGTTDEVLQDLPGSNFELPNASATQDPSPTSNKKRNRSSGLTEEDSL